MSTADEISATLWKLFHEAEQIDPDAERRATVRDWLRGLYGTCEDGWLSITHLVGGAMRTDWVPVSDLEAAVGPVIERSASYDVWAGVATRSQRCGSQRGGAEDCAEIPALWADIDVQHPVHHQGADLPPTFDAAHSLIAAFAVPPTAIVNTGHGLQPWWLLAEPLDAQGEEVRVLLDRWEATWLRLAGERGWSIDGVWDLPRMLRVPGSFNRKPNGDDAVPVVVEQVDWGRRYGLDDLDPWLDPPPPPPEPRAESNGQAGNRPGDLWAARHSWAEILTADGASLHKHATTRFGSYEQWCRPGVDDHLGATLGYGGSDVLKVFTSAWTVNGVTLPQGATYTRFGYLAATRHGGDFSAASAALAQQGYRVDPADLIASGSTEDTARNGQKPAASVREVDWRSQVRTLDQVAQDGDEPVYDWLVDDLIERGDRIIITGDEGYGKSTLQRQLGLGVAAGINPFARNPLFAAHEPGRVLLIDCENSRRQLDREFPKGWRRVADRLGEIGPRFHIVQRTDGLVLDDPRDRDGDRALLRAMVDGLAPDLLLIGPLYKLLGGDPNAEEDARNLVKFLDKLRGPETRMAVVVEAHAPHGQQRPSGWSGLKRWPEFGLHLTAEGALVSFRGGRDGDRHWPHQLRRGGPDEWLWMPADASTGAEPVDREAAYDEGVRAAVLRVFHKATRALTMAEIIDRAARRPPAVRKAVRHFEDNGWLIVGKIDVITGATRRTKETFRLDPHGPGGDHDA